MLVRVVSGKDPERTDLDLPFSGDIRDSWSWVSPDSTSLDFFRVNDSLSHFFGRLCLFPQGSCKHESHLPQPRVRYRGRVDSRDRRRRIPVEGRVEFRGVQRGEGLRKEVEQDRDYVGPCGICPSNPRVPVGSQPLPSTNCLWGSEGKIMALLRLRLRYRRVSQGWSFRDNGDRIEW